MSTSEKFCLKWNDFQENVTTTFRSLRDANEFSDVTLACEDGQQVEGHKVVLAASSPFFQNLFRKNKHAHPLVYMRGMEFNDLKAIVDFLYYGEANIFQENIDSFLKIATELKLKGLNGDGSNKVMNEPNFNEHCEDEKRVRDSDDFFKSTYVTPNKNPAKQENISLNYNRDGSESHANSERAVALPKEDFSGNLQDLDPKVRSMMVLGHNMLANALCEKR